VSIHAERKLYACTTIRGVYLKKQVSRGLKKFVIVGHYKVDNCLVIQQNSQQHLRENVSIPIALFLNIGFFAIFFSKYS